MNISQLKEQLYTHLKNSNSNQIKPSVSDIDNILNKDLLTFQDIINTPINLGIDTENITTNYNDIDVNTNSQLFNEKLVNIEPELNEFKSFNRSLLPSSETRTKNLWARESVARKLVLANEILKLYTKDNTEEFGGQLQLHLKDIYKPIEAQISLWNNILNREIKNANGNKEEGYRIAKILCSEPTNFNPNNPKTAPIHTTGGAVDTFLYSDKGSQYAIITITDYTDENGINKVVDHYNTDYFEKKLKNNKNLTDEEALCLRNRRILFYIMFIVGFENYIKEPWHFDYKDQMYAMMKNKRYNMNIIAEYGYAKHPEK